MATTLAQPKGGRQRTDAIQTFTLKGERPEFARFQRTFGRAGVTISATSRTTDHPRKFQNSSTYAVIRPHLRLQASNAANRYGLRAFPNLPHLPRIQQKRLDRMSANQCTASHLDWRNWFSTDLCVRDWLIAKIASPDNARSYHSWMRFGLGHLDSDAHDLEDYRQETGMLKAFEDRIVNPVVFLDQPATDELVVYSTNLSEFAWKDRLVGLTNSGFLYVDQRVAQQGYYEYYPKLLEWKNVEECKASKHVGIKGIIFGLLMLAQAFFAFMAGWVNQTHTGPGIVTYPLVCGIGGGLLVLGALRNRIVVVTHDATYQWISEPLTFHKTRAICLDAVHRCRGRSNARIISYR